MTPLWLLTFFVCHPHPVQGIICGVSTGNQDHPTETACKAAGRAYRQAQEDAALALPGTLRFTCWQPGMGYVAVK